MPRHGHNNSTYTTVHLLRIVWILADNATFHWTIAYR